MQVRFSPDIFRVQRHGGVSRYVAEVHRGLLVRGIDSRIVAGLHRAELLAGVPRVTGIDVDRLRPERARQALTRVVDSAISRAQAARLPAGAVWHPSYFTAVRPRRAVMAITVHDMIHERYPDEVSPRDITPRVKRPSCRAADVIFTNSHDTAVDLEERFGIDADRVVVTHLGATRHEPAGRPDPFGGRPYLLSVGDRAPRYKNWLTLLDALVAAGPDARLACFGAPERPDEHAAIVERGLAGRVRFAGGGDRELAGWYAAAAALVYPSRYEGFGLPPLEAMVHGCPVVATRVGAVPEVVGDAAVLVEPTAGGLAAGIEQVLAGGPDVERLRRLGPERAAPFTWQATADATLAGYRRLVG